MHEGKRYFQAHTPTSGSFVRPNKVSFGISFEEAILARYRPYDAAATATDLIGLSEQELCVENDGVVTTIEISGVENMQMAQTEMEKMKTLFLFGSPIYGLSPGKYV